VREQDTLYSMSYSTKIMADANKIAFARMKNNAGALQHSP
jgi:hypothetical protein